MSGPTPDEVRAEIDYRQERVRETFAAGRTGDDGRLEVSVTRREIERLRDEIERCRTERKLARIAFECHRDMDTEIAYVEADARMQKAKEAYASAVELALR